MFKECWHIRGANQGFHQRLTTSECRSGLWGQVMCGRFYFASICRGIKNTMGWGLRPGSRPTPSCHDLVGRSGFTVEDLGGIGTWTYLARRMRSSSTSPLLRHRDRIPVQTGMVRGSIESGHCFLKLPFSSSLLSPSSSQNATPLICLLPGASRSS